MKETKDAKASSAAYPRGEKGLFGVGNKGKPKGAVSWQKNALAAIARELVEEHAGTHFADLFGSKVKRSPALYAVRQKAIEFLVERGWGKAPVTVRVGGIAPDSPEGILLAAASQHIPGLEPPETED